MHRFDRCVISNVYRADYIECLVTLTLGPAWWITWARGWDWAPWDCQHPSGARLEVKQAAARQSWDRDACDRVPARGVRAWRPTRYPAGRAGTLRLPRWAA